MVAAYKVFHGHADVKGPSPFFQVTRNGGYVAQLVKKSIKFSMSVGPIATRRVGRPRPYST